MTASIIADWLVFRCKTAVAPNTKPKLIPKATVTVALSSLVDLAYILGIFFKSRVLLCCLFLLAFRVVVIFFTRRAQLNLGSAGSCRLSFFFNFSIVFSFLTVRVISFIAFSCLTWDNTLTAARLSDSFGACIGLLLGQSLHK